MRTILSSNTRRIRSLTNEIVFLASRTEARTFARVRPLGSVPRPNPTDQFVTRSLCSYTHKIVKAKRTPEPPNVAFGNGQTDSVAPFQDTWSVGAEPLPRRDERRARNRRSIGHRPLEVARLGRLSASTDPRIQRLKPNGTKPVDRYRLVRGGIGKTGPEART